jgi:tetratricopeptide (TPR) repeat protein
MATLYKVTGKEAESERMYANLVNIKKKYYGEASESLMVTLKNLGGVQIMSGKYQEAIATLEEAIQVIHRIIDGNKAKDQQAFRTHSTEIVILLMTVQERQPGYPIDFSKVNRYEDTLVKIHGNDKNIYLAQFLSIKARKMQMSEGINPELTLANV